MLAYLSVNRLTMINCDYRYDYFGGAVKGMIT